MNGTLPYDWLRITWKDILDILIVTFIVYQVLRLARGTRSAQMIVGMILIAGIAFIAYFFQFEALTWLFSNLATVGFIVLVVVFQPELRSALASFGQNRLFRMFVRLEQKKTLEEVTRAALRLSELRYGGLIVIERRTGLRNFAETGKEMNAALSSELLVTLFTPYTPLHDGAVLIAGEYVIAAATSLPLTSNPRYSKLYGMRHKAAIGVTELSDAVVVVVSEESSQISIAYDGQLESNIVKGELRDRLGYYLKQ
ncbi:MAG: TIGR00159 family protein [candidate division Zixibacteria bacterium]|nr:TIGR00159 family protein [candidate division Zixibacteria bacterium]